MMTEAELIRKVRSILGNALNNSDPMGLYSAVGYAIGLIDSDGIIKGTDATKITIVEKKPAQSFEEFCEEVKEKGGYLDSDGYHNKDKLERYHSMNLKNEINKRINNPIHANTLYRIIFSFGIKDMCDLMAYMDDCSHTSSCIKNINYDDFCILRDIYLTGCSINGEEKTIREAVKSSGEILGISKNTVTRVTNALIRSNIYSVRQLKLYCKEHKVGKLRGIGPDGVRVCNYIVDGDCNL